MKVAREVSLTYEVDPGVKAPIAPLADSGRKSLKCKVENMELAMGRFNSLKFL